MPTEEFLRDWYQRYDVLGEREPYYQALRVDDPWQTVEGREIRERFEFVKAEVARCQPSNVRCLDIGSGPGLFLELAKWAGWQGIGIELGERAAASSRERFGIDVRAGTIESVGLPRESFDVITLWDILEHVRDPRRLAERAASLIKPGGLLFIETPNASSVLDWAVVTLARLGMPGPATTFYGLHHLTLWNPSNIRRLLEETGFAIREINFDTTPASRVFRGATTRDRLMRLCVGLIQFAGKFLRKENKMIITAQNIQ